MRAGKRPLAATAKEIAILKEIIDRVAVCYPAGD